MVIYGLITFFDPKNKKELDESDVKISKTNNYLKLFVNGYFLNFINVGVLAGWLGIMVIIAPSLIIGYLVTDLVKIFMAKQLQKKMTPIVIYKMKKGMGILLIVFGVVMLLKPFVF